MSRSRTLLRTAAIVTGLLALPVTAQAVCIPNNFPANWLQQQENAGGHTIARHVGQTDIQLTTRLQNQGLNAVGSYPSSGAPYPAAAAQATITAGVAANRNVINNWAANANAGATMAYNYVTAPPATIAAAIPATARRTPNVGRDEALMVSSPDLCPYMIPLLGIT